MFCEVWEKILSFDGNNKVATRARYVNFGTERDSKIPAQYT
jgi:hypothetical protein